MIWTLGQLGQLGQLDQLCISGVINLDATLDGSWEIHVLLPAVKFRAPGDLDFSTFPEVVAVVAVVVWKSPRSITM